MGQREDLAHFAMNVGRPDGATLPAFFVPVRLWTSRLIQGLIHDELVHPFPDELVHPFGPFYDELVHPFAAHLI